MKHATIVLAIAVLIATAAPALGDWDPGDPYKWLQRPDLTPTGMDVKTGTIWTEPDSTKILADDFQCEQPGYITDIHIWGSWKYDELPTQDHSGNGGSVPDPGNVAFLLDIWSDVAVGQDPDVDWSHPGEHLTGWLLDPMMFTVREVLPAGPEDWYDPNQEEWQDDNHQRAFQYNFHIPTDEQFFQEGTTTNPITYWLSVEAVVLDEQAVEFGWKTSVLEDRWNDDATWSDWVKQADGTWLLDPWSELRYPLGHEYETQSVDLAFVIVPEPATMSLLAIGGVVALIRRRRS